MRCTEKAGARPIKHFDEEAMTTKSAPAERSPQLVYQLDEGIRRKILSETPAAKIREQMELERSAFILVYGSAFGDRSGIE